MPWVHFSRQFDWRPHPRQIFRYKPGTRCLVTTRCANEAIAASKAEKIPTPHRDEVKK